MRAKPATWAAETGSLSAATATSAAVAGRKPVNRPATPAGTRRSPAYQSTRQSTLAVTLWKASSASRPGEAASAASQLSEGQDVVVVVDEDRELRGLLLRGRGVQLGLRPAQLGDERLGRLQARGWAERNGRLSLKAVDRLQLLRLAMSPAA